MLKIRYFITIFLLIVLPKLVLSHSAMFRDDYKFDNSNEGAKPDINLFTQAKTTQCTGGSAGGYPCLNINLQSILPITELGGNSNHKLNDIWGWTDPLTGKEYAIVGREGGTSFVDVSDANNPFLVAYLPTADGVDAWRDIKVYNDHAYIVADLSRNRNHGMQVYDLRLLTSITPGSVVEATALYTGFGNAHNIVINEDTGFAYAVGSNRCSGGLHMVDIANPLAPEFAGCFSADGYTHDAQCVVYAGPDAEHTGKEICVGYNEDTITIVDVSNKANPLQLSRTGYTGSRYTHQGWFLDGNHSVLIMNDEADESRIGINTTSYIYDVSDLDAPVELGRYVGPTEAIDHNLYTVTKNNKNYVIEANYRAGLRVLSTEEINNGKMTEVALFDTIPGSNSAQFSGAWSSYPYFSSGNIVVSDIGTGLFVLTPDWDAIDTPTQPGYCEASSEDADYEWIANVSVNNFSNTTDSSNYSDFTQQTIPLVFGDNSLRLTPGFRSQTYAENWRVWIDLNQDGQFSDSDELIYATETATSDPIDTVITIPSTANPGKTRLRVAMVWNAVPQACGSFRYGEVEDYSVDISGDAPPPPPACTRLNFDDGGTGGWSNASIATCSTGSFIVGSPSEQSNGGVTTQVDGAFGGSGFALYTAANTSAGSNDVDGGTCIAESPSYTVDSTSEISLQYFHGQRDAGDDSGDFFALEYSVDGGGSWTDWVVNGDERQQAQWTKVTTVIPATADLRLRVRVADGPATGDLVEAGIDELEICPVQ